jgi:hypothetical protein
MSPSSANCVRMLIWLVRLLDIQLSLLLVCKLASSGNRVREMEMALKNSEAVSIDHLNTIAQFRELVKSLQSELAVCFLFDNP